MSRRTPRLLVAVAAVGLSGGLVLASAAPALADTPELWNTNARWFDVSSSQPSVGDAESAYRDLLGSGVDLPFGWTGDALDGALAAWQVSDGVTSASIGWSAVSETVDASGRSTWTYAGTVGAFPTAAFTAVLEIEGSTARWVITPTGTASGLVISASGDLGSDTNETFVVVTPNSAVVSSDNVSRDPVLGYWFSAPSGTWTPGSGVFTFSFVDSGPATMVLALQDYAVCAEQTAVDEMIARVPTLGAQFGITIDGALGCLTSSAPSPLAVGTAVSQTLGLTLDPAVDPFLGSGAAPFSLDSGVITYFGDPGYVGSAVVGLPAGVTGTVDAATQTVHLSGTPTEAGTFEASAIVYRTDVLDYWVGEPGNGIPLVAPFTVTVAEGGAELAATGLADVASPSVLAAVLLGAGALTLAVGSRPRRVDARS